MDRINGAGHVGHLFVSEDVNIPREPTEITPEWLNGVQEELVGLVESAGLVPSSASLTQVATAIKTIFQKAAAVSADAAGTVDAITAAYAPAITALSNNLRLTVRASGANTSATPTFWPGEGAAKTIVKGHNQPLVAGDISGAGFRAELQYDQAIDKWLLLNPATGVSVASGLQAGEITFFARNTAPTGYFKANGAAVSRSTYAALFAAIGTTFGVGDGATTFNLPDLRGEFVRGWDDSRGIDSGRAFGSFQGGAIESHAHAVKNYPSNTGSTTRAPSTWTSSVTQDGSASTEAAGGSETRPRNIALLACIKY